MKALFRTLGLLFVLSLCGIDSAQAAYKVSSLSASGGARATCVLGLTANTREALAAECASTGQTVAGYPNCETNGVGTYNVGGNQNTAQEYGPMFVGLRQQTGATNSCATPSKVMANYSYAAACPAGQALENNVCRTPCPSGQTRESDGQCYAPCPSGQVRQPDMSCATPPCPQGSARPYGGTDCTPLETCASFGGDKVGQSPIRPNGMVLGVKDLGSNGSGCVSPFESHPNNELQCVVRVVGTAATRPSGTTTSPGAGITYGYWEYVGTACGSGQETAQTPPAETGTEQEKCESTNGNTVCNVIGQPKCIKVNGEKSCMSSAGDICHGSDCLLNGDVQEVLKQNDGSQITAPNTPTPPAPDTGVTGTPAAPDLKLQTGKDNGSGYGVNNTWNYFNKGTVEGSSTRCGPGTHLDGEECKPNGTGSGGTGGGDGEGEGSENTLQGGADCTAPPTCDGDPTACYIARQAWTQSCVFKRPSKDETDAAFRTGAGDDSLTEGSMLPLHNTVQANTWMQQLNLGSGSCPPDFSVTVTLPVVGSQSVNFPMSRNCNFIKMIRAFILIGALFIAVQIYLGGFKD